MNGRHTGIVLLLLLLLHYYTRTPETRSLGQVRNVMSVTYFVRSFVRFVRRQLRCEARIGEKRPARRVSHDRQQTRDAKTARDSPVKRGTARIYVYTARLHARKTRRTPKIPSGILTNNLASRDATPSPAACLAATCRRHRAAALVTNDRPLRPVGHVPSSMKYYERFARLEKEFRDYPAGSKRTAGDMRKNLIWLIVDNIAM